MGTPHKHAELIKAWADGAEIQWFNPIEKSWRDVKNPFWSINTKYRIKPEPKKVQYRFFEDSNGKFRCWTNTWELTQEQVEQRGYFKQWLSTLEEREFDV